VLKPVKANCSEGGLTPAAIAKELLVVGRMLDSLAGADAGWTPTSYGLALRDLYAEDRFAEDGSPRMNHLEQLD
jgi:hypothetical protein